MKSKKTTKKQTIAGDIRRIRKLLIPCDDHKHCMVDYISLLHLFESIESKAKEMQKKIEMYEGG